MSGEQREAIRERLQLIADRNGGRITADDVIADAKDKDSPLHSQFTWDKTKAAMEHWRETARQLIRSVRIIIRTDNRIVSTIGYVRDPGAASKDQGYMSTTVLRNDAEAARSAIVYEFGRAAAALRRAYEVADALDLRNDLESLIATVERTKTKLQNKSGDSSPV